VLVGASDTASLLNLKAAINASAGGAGVAYGVGTVANANVNAGTATATTLVVTANVNGTVGTLSGLRSELAVGHLPSPAQPSLAAPRQHRNRGRQLYFVSVLSATATANE